MAVNLPAMIGLAMVANIAVPVLFGPQWEGTVPVLQILCLAGALFPMQVSNLQVLMAQGHSGKMFRIGAIKNGILIVSMLIASHWGMLAIAWATVFSSLVSLFLNTHYSRLLIGYGALKQVRDLYAYVLLTAGMVVLVSLLAYTLSWMTPGKRLLIEVAAGATFYLGMAFALHLPAVSFAVEVFRSLWCKRPGNHWK
jgi:O-antigen/teichoic acid export membrane protein